MNLYQRAQLVVQIAGIAGLLITLYFHFRQVKLMGVQLEQVRQSTTAGHILAMLSMMETEDIREARSLVHTRLPKKPFAKWTEEEIHAASKVCVIYANAGTFLKSGLVPREPILESWGASLRLTYEILEPLIRDMQRSETVGAEYWKDFEWVYQQALEVEARKQARRANPKKRRGLRPLRHEAKENTDAV
jgi:hypothetical protein